MSGITPWSVQLVPSPWVWSGGVRLKHSFSSAVPGEVLCHRGRGRPTQLPGTRQTGKLVALHSKPSVKLMMIIIAIIIISITPITTTIIPLACDCEVHIAFSHS